MHPSENNLRIDYVEFPAKDIDETKKFYSTLLGWKFEDYGEDYTSFHDGRLGGGFFKSDNIKPGGPLIVIYTTDIDAMLGKIAGAGSKIVKPIFAFPGGKRFQFFDPSGNELAIWSDK